jgi:hypothetical protein
MAGKEPFLDMVLHNMHVFWLPLLCSIAILVLHWLVRQAWSWLFKPVHKGVEWDCFLLFALLSEMLFSPLQRRHRRWGRLVTALATRILTQPARRMKIWTGSLQIEPLGLNAYVR